VYKPTSDISFEFQSSLICAEDELEISVKKKHDDIPITMIKHCERDVLRAIFGSIASTLL
jgi:hypothetical protein